jgi:hypothetical protein
MRTPIKRRCPQCGAEPGQPCWNRPLGSKAFHAARMKGVSREPGQRTTLDDGDQSVRALSGGAFESNRRTH